MKRASGESAARATDRLIGIGPAVPLIRIGKRKDPTVNRLGDKSFPGWVCIRPAASIGNGARWAYKHEACGTVVILASCDIANHLRRETQPKCQVCK